MVLYKSSYTLRTNSHCSTGNCGYVCVKGMRKSCVFCYAVTCSYSHSVTHYGQTVIAGPETTGAGAYRVSEKTSIFCCMVLYVSHHTLRTSSHCLTGEVCIGCQKSRTCYCLVLYVCSHKLQTQSTTLGETTGADI